MALEIFWSKRADNKFDKILEYLNSEWGERVTSAFVKKVYDFLDILVEFPEIGTLENTKRNIRGFVIVKQITIFYKLSGDNIILLNFFDNRQNLKRKKF
jgi:plasmid stabilization system protein ParE